MNQRQRARRDSVARRLAVLSHKVRTARTADRLKDLADQLMTINERLDDVFADVRLSEETAKDLALVRRENARLR